jgi:hypothetical protein
MLDEELGYFKPRPWHRDRPQKPKTWHGPSDVWGAPPTPEHLRQREYFVISARPRRERKRIDAASPTRGISRRAEHPGFACVSEGRSVKNAANRFSRR